MKFRHFVMLSTFLVIQQVVLAQKTLNRPSKWAQKVSTSILTNMFRINDSIYRCEQPNRLGFLLIDSLQIKSVLNLRANYSDKQRVGQLPLRIFDVPMVAESIDDSQIIAALRVLRHSPKPIVVHCMKGSDRTGVVLAMYRIVFQNWTRDMALLEMMEGGYGFHRGYKNIPAYIKCVDVTMIRKEVLK